MTTTDSKLKQCSFDVKLSIKPRSDCLHHAQDPTDTRKNNKYNSKATGKNRSDNSPVDGNYRDDSSEDSSYTDSCASNRSPNNGIRDSKRAAVSPTTSVEDSASTPVQSPTLITPLSKDISDRRRNKMMVNAAHQKENSSVKKHNNTDDDEWVTLPFADITKIPNTSIKTQREITEKDVEILNEISHLASKLLHRYQTQKCSHNKECLRNLNENSPIAESTRLEPSSQLDEDIEESINESNIHANGASDDEDRASYDSQVSNKRIGNNSLNPLEASIPPSESKNKKSVIAKLKPQEAEDFFMLLFNTPADKLNPNHPFKLKISRQDPTSCKIDKPAEKKRPSKTVNITQTDVSSADKFASLNMDDLDTSAVSSSPRQTFLNGQHVNNQSSTVLSKGENYYNDKQKSVQDGKKSKMDSHKKKKTSAEKSVLDDKDDKDDAGSLRHCPKSLRGDDLEFCLKLDEQLKVWKTELLTELLNAFKNGKDPSFRKDLKTGDKKPTRASNSRRSEAEASGTAQKKVKETDRCGRKNECPLHSTNKIMKDACMQFLLDSCNRTFEFFEKFKNDLRDPEYHELELNDDDNNLEDDDDDHDVNDQKDQQNNDDDYPSDQPKVESHRDSKMVPQKSDVEKKREAHSCKVTKSRTKDKSTKRENNDSKEAIQSDRKSNTKKTDDRNARQKSCRCHVTRSKSENLTRPPNVENNEFGPKVIGELKLELPKIRGQMLNAQIILNSRHRFGQKLTIDERQEDAGNAKVNAKHCRFKVELRPSHEAPKHNEMTGKLVVSHVDSNEGSEGSEVSAEVLSDNVGRNFVNEFSESEKNYSEVEPCVTSSEEENLDTQKIIQPVKYATVAIQTDDSDKEIEKKLPREKETENKKSKKSLKMIFGREKNKRSPRSASEPDKRKTAKRNVSNSSTQTERSACRKNHGRSSQNVCCKPSSSPQKDANFSQNCSCHIGCQSRQPQNHRKYISIEPDLHFRSTSNGYLTQNKWLKKGWSDFMDRVSTKPLESTCSSKYGLCQRPITNVCHFEDKRCVDGLHDWALGYSCDNTKGNRSVNTSDAIKNASTCMCSECKLNKKLRQKRGGFRVKYPKGVAWWIGKKTADKNISINNKNRPSEIDNKDFRTSAEAVSNFKNTLRKYSEKEKQSKYDKYLPTSLFNPNKYCQKLQDSDNLNKKLSPQRKTRKSSANNLNQTKKVRESQFSKNSNQEEILNPNTLTNNVKINEKILGNKCCEKRQEFRFCEEINRMINSRNINQSWYKLPNFYESFEQKQNPLLGSSYLKEQKCEKFQEYLPKESKNYPNIKLINEFNDKKEKHDSCLNKEFNDNIKKKNEKIKSTEQSYHAQRKDCLNEFKEKIYDKQKKLNLIAKIDRFSNGFDPFIHEKEETKNQTENRSNQIFDDINISKNTAPCSKATNNQITLRDAHKTEINNKIKSRKDFSKQNYIKDTESLTNFKRYLALLSFDPSKDECPNLPDIRKSVSSCTSNCTTDKQYLDCLKTKANQIKEIESLSSVSSFTITPIVSNNIQKTVIEENKTKKSEKKFEEDYEKLMKISKDFLREYCSDWNSDKDENEHNMKLQKFCNENSGYNKDDYERNLTKLLNLSNDFLKIYFSEKKKQNKSEKIETDDSIHDYIMKSNKKTDKNKLIKSQLEDTSCNDKKYQKNVEDINFRLNTLTIDQSNTYNSITKSHKCDTQKDNNFKLCELKRSYSYEQNLYHYMHISNKILENCKKIEELELISKSKEKDNTERSKTNLKKFSNENNSILNNCTNRSQLCKENSSIEISPANSDLFCCKKDNFSNKSELEAHEKKYSSLKLNKHCLSSLKNVYNDDRPDITNSLIKYLPNSFDRNPNKKIVIGDSLSDVPIDRNKILSGRNSIIEFFPPNKRFEENAFATNLTNPRIPSLEPKAQIYRNEIFTGRESIIDFFPPNKKSEAKAFAASLTKPRSQSQEPNDGRKRIDACSAWQKSSNECDQQDKSQEKKDSDHRKLIKTPHVDCSSTCHQSTTQTSRNVKHKCLKQSSSISCAESSSYRSSDSEKVAEEIYLLRMRAQTLAKRIIEKRNSRKRSKENVPCHRSIKTENQNCFKNIIARNDETSNNNRSTPAVCPFEMPMYECL